MSQRIARSVQHQQNILLGLPSALLPSDLLPRATAMQRVLAVALAFLTMTIPLCTASPEGQALQNISASFSLTSLGWTGENPCGPPVWNGVTCSLDGLHVIGLDLSGLGLKGPLPSSFGELTHLQSLNLSGNMISGIPQSFGNLTSLTNLTMSRNTLSGPFPSVLLQLTNITLLKLDNTMLQGPLPDGIGNLRKLQFLYLGNNTSLIGPLPAASLGQLTALVELTMWGSNLNTTLPVELANCTKLQYLNFHACGMSGSLPQEYGYLPLRRVQLQNNYITGEMPQSWSNLMPHVTEMELYNNLLYGDFPSFLLNSTGVISISCNYFKGATPSGNKSVIYDNGNCFQDLVSSHAQYCEPTATCQRFYQLLNETLPGNPTSASNSTATLLGAILGSLAGLVALVIVGFGLYKWWKYRNQVPDYFNERTEHSKGERSTEHWEVPKGIHRFTLHELAKATEGFNKVYHIGAGGFGQVYSGVLEDGTLVAIKRANKESLTGETEFRNELTLLSRLHHRHLVRLEGFCDDHNQQILVYEFMPHGNLHTHIQGTQGNRTLSWYKRIEVALGAALGLEYLHSFADPPVIHRDVKPSNILLDDQNVAKLADFGISKVGNDIDTHISTRPAGTAGFLDPDYFITRQLTPASDVYSFGVVLLELITGQKAIDHQRQADDINLLTWVNSHSNAQISITSAIIPNAMIKPRFASGGIDKVVDPRLQPNYSNEAYSTMTELALRCTAYERLDRPTIKTVVQVLENVLKEVKEPLSEYPSSRPSFSTTSSNVITSNTNTGSHTGTHSYFSDAGTTAHTNDHAGKMTHTDSSLVR